MSYLLIEKMSIAQHKMITIKLPLESQTAEMRASIIQGEYCPSYKKKIEKDNATGEGWSNF